MSERIEWGSKEHTRALRELRELQERQRIADEPGPGAALRYGVWCEVSGGVTGYRSAWLKGKGGAVWRGTESEANRKASSLERESNGNPYRTAAFRYEARPIGYAGPDTFCHT